MNTEEQLAWEAKHRVKAGIAAIVAALLGLAGGIYSGLTLSDVPRTTVLETLERVAEPGPVGTQPSGRIALFEWYDAHGAELLIGAVLTALSMLLIAGALTFLANATRARRPEFPRIAVYLAMLGGVLMALGVIAVAVGTGMLVDDILATDRRVDTVGDVEANGLLAAGQLAEQVVGRFALGAAFILISLHAMRVGLLTRFMGVLGIIAGVLLALPIFGGPLPVVQSVWLVAVGLLFLGRAAGGIPPAWRTGQAEPWPSGAELRQARMEASSPEPDREPETPGTPHPSSKKKRKKRR